MFRKRTKKYFPPGTFIPTPARISAIIQLCLAFTLFLWISSQPFMGDLFAIKSKMLTYENAMGIQKQADRIPLLERNRERFFNLPENARSVIESDYRFLEDQTKITFFQKLKKMSHLLFAETSPYVQAWLLFSFLIPIFLLIRIDGAHYVVWLLPLITLAYAIDNQMYESPQKADAQAQFFPSEKYLMDTYVHEELDKDIFIQQEQLRKGWQLYLSTEWAHEKPSTDRDQLALQVEKGEYAFNINRLLHVRANESFSSISNRYRESLWILGVYIVWNFLFAYLSWKHTNRLQVVQEKPANIAC